MSLSLLMVALDSSVTIRRTIEEAEKMYIKSLLSLMELIYVFQETKVFGTN